MKSKHRDGEWKVEKQEDGFYSIWIDIRGTGATIAENIGEEANAQLIAEAGNVANKTGLTPRQLVDQGKELLLMVSKLTAINKKLKGIIDQAIKKAEAEA